MSAQYGLVVAVRNGRCIRRATISGGSLTHWEPDTYDRWAISLCGLCRVTIALAHRGPSLADARRMRKQPVPGRAAGRQR